MDELLVIYWTKVCENERISRQRNEELLLNLNKIEKNSNILSMKLEKLMAIKVKYENQLELMYPNWRDLISKNKQKDNNIMENHLDNIINLANMNNSEYPDINENKFQINTKQGNESSFFKEEIESHLYNESKKSLMYKLPTADETNNLTITYSKSNDILNKTDQIKFSNFDFVNYSNGENVTQDNEPKVSPYRVDNTLQNILISRSNKKPIKQTESIESHVYKYNSENINEFKKEYTDNYHLNFQTLNNENNLVNLYSDVDQSSKILIDNDRINYTNLTSKSLNQFFDISIKSPMHVMKNILDENLDNNCSNLNIYNNIKKNLTEISNDINKMDSDGNTNKENQIIAPISATTDYIANTVKHSSESINNHINKEPSSEIITIEDNHMLNNTLEQDKDKISDNKIIFTGLTNGKDHLLSNDVSVTNNTQIDNMPIKMNEIQNYCIDKNITANRSNVLKDEDTKPNNLDHKSLSNSDNNNDEINDEDNDDDLDIIDDNNLISNTMTQSTAYRQLLRTGNFSSTETENLHSSLNKNNTIFQPKQCDSPVIKQSDMASIVAKLIDDDDDEKDGQGRINLSNSLKTNLTNNDKDDDDDDFYD